MYWRVKELIAVLKINVVKDVNAGKITQTSGANSEHKHSEVERFLCKMKE